MRYVADPFHDMRLGSFDAEGVRGSWVKTWAKGEVVPALVEFEVAVPHLSPAEW